MAEIGKLLKEATNEEINLEEIKESEMADFSSTTAFRLASKLKKSPVEIADEISGRITPSPYVERIESTRGYINFYLNYKKILSEFLNEVKGKKFGYGKGEDKNKKIILEHTSINPSGPVHVGRLRNSLIGDSLSRILKFYGYDVETHYYVNDIGKQMGVIAQGFKEGIEPDKDAIERYSEYKDKEDFEIFFEYISANRKFETDIEFQKGVQESIQHAEKGDLNSLQEISRIARKCLVGQKKILDRLGIKFDKFDFESKYLEDGSVLSVLAFLRKSDYARTVGEGFGLDLSKFGLEKTGGVSILARKDDTSVYLTRDIAYHLEKSKLGDIMINVLGEDHRFEFLELKTILTEIYKLEIPLEVVHFSFVIFEGGELSTRKGLTAPVDKLLDDAIEKAGGEIEKRKIATREIAPGIGIGAIKYHILKTTPQKPITFKWEEALSFDGEASPYIQYAHARCCRILENSKIDVEKIEIDEIDMNLEEHEKNLLKQLIKFPEIVKKSAEELKPNIIANYLYLLASEFSRFYKNCPVIPAEEKTRWRRLLLVDAARIVIANGLDLLGISTPERM